MLALLKRSSTLFVVVVVLLAGLAACSSDKPEEDLALPPTTDETTTSEAPGTTGDSVTTPPADGSWAEQAIAICESYDDRRRDDFPPFEDWEELMLQMDDFVALYESQLADIEAIEAPDEGQGAVLAEQLRGEIDIMHELQDLAEADDPDSFFQQLLGYGIYYVHGMNRTLTAAGVVECAHPEIK